MPEPPAHPFMAPVGRSNIHNDAWMTDAYLTPGPLGRSPRTDSVSLGALCGTITFDRAGRLETTCTGTATPRLLLLGPKTLGVLASMDLPRRETSASGANPFQDFTGGGYFYLDHRDRAVIPTTTRHVFVVAQRRNPDGSISFVVARDYDLGTVLGTERISSVLPDWTGRYWFVSKAKGMIGTVDRSSGTVRTITLGEEVENSFAVGEDGGVFVVSDRAMYRFDPDRRGGPRVTWRAPYRNSGIAKPGQVDAGSGTTPTLMGGGLVAITDNADPMNVVVYRRAKRVAKGRRRVVCEQPVFGKGAGDTENSPIALGRSLLVENNYGYVGPTATSGGATTTPGFARVDVDPRRDRCRLVWTNTTDAGPSVVSKASAATGLLYTYTKPTTPGGVDAWYWTALDVRTGRRVWRQLAGTGFAYNNNYAGLVLGPRGIAYLGVFGGIITMRDAAGGASGTPADDRP
ncbi:MAG: hypothetical protein U0V73_16110 [Acidimicrobiia bacterium]